MIKDNNKNKQQQYDPMTELELTKLAEKIVAKMMRLKTVEDWFKHMAKTKLADNEDVERICQRMNQVLLRIGFVGQPTEDTFMRSIRRVFRRSLRLEKRDVATLHKFCNEIDLYVDHCSGSSKSHLSNSKE